MSSPSPTLAEPVLTALVRNRPTLGIVLAILALGLLAGSGYCFVKAFTDVPAAEQSAEEKLKTPIKEGAEPDLKLLRPYATEYQLGGVAAALAGIVCGMGAGWLIGRPVGTTGGTPAPPVAREDRILLFAVAGAVGLALMLLGFALFYLWFGELTKWLGQAEKTQPIKPLVALLLLLIGAGLVFLGVQPLRAEERNDPILRRIVYGTNFFLTGLLLVFALVFVNIVATQKLPSKLDTTETGFYTLSQPTLDYLNRLDKDVVIYTTIPDSSQGMDVIRVLNAFQEANPRNVKLKPLSLTLDKSEIVALKTKFPTADLVDANGSIKLGVVLAIGPDEKRYQFISQAELFGREGAGGQQRRTLAVEPRIIREILFLTENKSKPVVYFTQGAGELGVDPPNPTDKSPNPRPAFQLKNALVADYCEVKPLKFDPLAVDPRIPDDATVVVVGDPTTKLADNMVAALRRYMTNPRPDGTKGKLLVIAGAHPATGQKAVLKIGIEELLAEYGVTPLDRVLYGEETQRLPYEAQFVRIPKELVQSKNTIALAFSNTASGVPLARPIAIDEKSTRVSAKPLLSTFEERVTWLEAEVLDNPARAYIDLVNAARAGRKDVVQKKMAGVNIWDLAAISADSDGTTGRVVVFGFGGFEDREATGEDARAYQAELITASVNWLRDRPAVANEGKAYGVYTPNPKFDFTRGLTLPVVLVVLAIAAIGLGLFVLRRR